MPPTTSRPYMAMPGALMTRPDLAVADFDEMMMIFSRAIHRIEISYRRGMIYRQSTLVALRDMILLPHAPHFRITLRTRGFLECPAEARKPLRPR